MCFRSHKFRLAVLAAIGLGASGCGGGGGSAPPAGSSPSATVVQGQFIDAAVAGLTYASGGQTGDTGGDGGFTCELGQTVTFSIGPITLPAVTCSADGLVVTPFTVFETNDPSDTSVQNLARLLQTLDSDGNPENGISIHPAVQTAASLPPDLDFASPSFDTDLSAFVSEVSTAGYTTNTSLVSAADAMAHMAKMDSLVGSWYATVRGAQVLLTFDEQGRYIHAENANADDAGQTGIETGTYTWNSSTGAFTSSCPSLDTNGEWGLSHPTPGTCSGATATMTVKGNSLAFAIDDEVLSFARVVDATKPIVGSWLGGDSSVLIVLTFFADGGYVHTEIGETDHAGQSGMERGGYIWNAATGAFASSCPFVDTNGQWGLSHQTPDLCAGTSATATISGNTLSLDLGDEGTVTFNRIVR